MEVEVCIEKMETALVADKYGATRVELCSALDLGGLTPSAGMVKSCVDNCNLQVFVMIRPKQGGFVYNQNEIEIMYEDIISAAASGANGVVFGCLTNDFNIDIIQNRKLVKLAKSLNLGLTFHRAFDFVIDMDIALEQIIELGFDRILTSGGAKTAFEGKDQIGRLLKKSNNRIEIMAGSGVSAQNCNSFKKMGVDAIHFTARKQLNPDDLLNMGIEYVPDEIKIKDIMLQKP